MAKEGVSREKIKALRTADLRYVGQGYELNLPVISGNIGKDEMAKIKNDFDNLHEKNYGFKRDDEVEFVNLRVSVFGEKSTSKFYSKIPAVKSHRGALKEIRKVYIKNKYESIPIYDRYKLGYGCKFGGPAMIEQKDSTTLIMAGNNLEVDIHGNLIITINN